MIICIRPKTEVRGVIDENGALLSRGGAVFSKNFEKTRKTFENLLTNKMRCDIIYKRSGVSDEKQNTYDPLAQ